MNDSSPQHQIAAALERLADERGEVCWRHAAAALRKAKQSAASNRGRRPINDAAALLEMDFILSTGEAKSIGQAARFVCTPSTKVGSIESVTRRLSRKYAYKIHRGD